MANYTIVELDTTAPHIEIHAPSYTTKDVVNTITIEANENIDNYQEIYVVDGVGNRTDYTFERTSNTSLSGLIKFSDTIGVVTIYARLRDEVGNYSETVSKNIEVKESLNLMTLKMKATERTITTKHAERTLLTKSHTRGVQWKTT